MRPRKRAARSARPLASTAAPIATAPIRKKTTSEASPLPAAESEMSGHKASRTTTMIAVRPMGVASVIQSTAPATMAPRTL